MKFIWKVFAVLFNYISVYEINNIFSSYLFLFAFFFFLSRKYSKGCADFALQATRWDLKHAIFCVV